MAYKFVIVFALFAVAHAGVVLPGAPVPVLAKTVALEEFDPHPQYKYGYNVQDSLSGDAKGHVEERDGDVVRGEYSLIDADGLKRTVTYVADPINGFNTIVRREPLVVAAPAPARIVAHAPAAVVASAPIVAHAPAPIVAHHSPVLRAAPVLGASAPLLRGPAPLAYAAPAPIAAPAYYRSAPYIAGPGGYALRNL